MINRMKISGRLWSMMSIFLVSTSFLVGLGLYNLYRINERIERVVEVDMKRKDLAIGQRAATRSGLRAMEMVLIFTDEVKIAEQLRVVAEQRRIADENLLKLEETLAVDNDKDLARLIDEDRTQMAIASKLNDSVVELARLNERRAAHDLLENKALPASEKWMKVIQKTVDYASGQIRQKNAEAKEIYRQSVLLLVSFGATSLAISGFLFWVIIRGIVRPLHLAILRLKDIAEGEGDLTKRLTVQGEDELAEMATWMNRFIENIEHIVREVAGGTVEVRDFARRLSTASQNLSASIEEISAQSRSVAASATEMNQNFQVISSSVTEMSNSVGEVARNAAESSKLAGQANETAGGANANIQKLGEDARAIGKVIEAIRGIAAQTNLLALNASIEAAGAGDAGKGFAVVASEVKELARQAAEATEEIRQRIEAVQGSTETAVGSIGEITSVIRHVNEFASSIASAVEEQSIAAKEISGNVNQSVRASDDVVQNLTGVSTATQDGARSAQGLSDLASALENLSGRLEQLVGRFKL